MANINRQWHRFTSIGCTHGNLANPSLLAAALEFNRRWKPDTRVHHGDYYDLTCFRTNAKGTKDEAAPLRDDIRYGTNFLREYRPTHLINGNHDQRAWELATHYNEIVKQAGQSIVDEITSLAAKLRCKHLADYDINNPGFTLGGVLFSHGFMWNEMFIRDHAETFGNCIIAHGHKAGKETGRRSDHPVCHCVGTLSDVPVMRYANRRRATLAWTAGIVWGEYSDDECIRWLHEFGKTDRLPV